MIALEKIKEHLIKTYQELKKYWEIAYHSIAIRITFFSLLAIITMLLLIPLTFDNSLLKFSLIQKISKASQADFDINGDVEVGLFPSPSITINEAVLLNFKHQPNFAKDQELYNFYAKKILIKFSISSFFSEEHISLIEFEDGFFESFSDPKNIPERNNKITEVLIGYKKLPAVSPTDSGVNISSSIFKISRLSDNDFQLYFDKIPLINFKNCALSIYNKIGRNKDFEKINATLKFSDKNNSGFGSFASEKTISKFSYHAKFNDDSSKPKSYFHIQSANLDLKIKGNYPEENKGLISSKFKGNLSIKISDLKSFYQTYFANEKSHIFGKLRSNNSSINISADIENETHELNFNEIKISSNLVSGSGDLYFAVDQQTPKMDINLDLDNIDLDAIISQDALKVDNYDLDSVIKSLSRINDQEKPVEFTKINEQELINQNNSNVNELNTEKNKNAIKNTGEIKPDFTKELRDFDINADIKINNLSFFENNFKDCSFYFNINKTGEILIAPVIIKTPGESSLYIRGSISNTQTIPKFIGVIDFKGKNFGEIIKWLKIESNKIKTENFGSFRFYANLFMIPNFTAFDEIYFNLNNSETEVFGSTKLVRENKNSIITTNFEFTNLSIDKYLKNQNQDIPIFDKQSLIKKVLWLNNLNSNSQISISFDKLIYQQEEFKNQKFKINLNRGFLNIDQVHLLSNKTDLNLDMRIDIADKIPVFDLKINGSKFSIFSDLSNHNQGENNQLPESINEPMVDENSKNNLINISNLFKGKTLPNNILDKFFSLPSLDSFNGGIDINLAELEYKNRKISNFKFKGEFKNGTINNSILSYKDLNGEISYKGIIDLKSTRIINGNLILKNINVNQLFQDLFNIKIFEGIANINANILSVATNSKEFFKDLKSEVKFGISQPVIHGLGINNLISKMLNPKNNLNELQEPEKIIFDSSAKTVFKNAKGSLIFKNSNEGKLKIEISGQAINSLLFGIINPLNNSFDLQLNSIFLAVNDNKTTPINLAIKSKGSPSNFNTVANTNQIRQYLGLENKNFRNNYQEQPITNNDSPKLPKNNINQDNSIKNNEINEDNKLINPDSKNDLMIDKSLLLPSNPNHEKTEKNEEPKI